MRMQSETFELAKEENAKLLDAHVPREPPVDASPAEGTISHDKLDYSQSDLNDLFAAAGKE